MITKRKSAGDQPLTGIFRRVTCHLPRQLSGEPTGNRRHLQRTAHRRRPFPRDVKLRSEVVTGAGRHRGRAQRPASCRSALMLIIWFLESVAAHALPPSPRGRGPYGRPSVHPAEGFRPEGSDVPRVPPMAAQLSARDVGRAGESCRHFPPLRAGNAARGELCKRPNCVTEARSSPPLSGARLPSSTGQGWGAPSTNDQEAGGNTMKPLNANTQNTTINNWTPAPRPTDAEIVGQYAADALRDGRYELGAVLAGIARQAHRAAYQTAARARGELFGSRTTDVPLIGTTREEHPRPAVCQHGYDTTITSDGLVVHSGTKGICDPGNTHLFDELAHRVRQAADETGRIQLDFVDTADPVDADGPGTPVTTGSRCVATVGTAAGSYECHQAIGWAPGRIGDESGPAVQAGWYHLDPEITDHEPVATVAQRR